MRNADSRTATEAEKQQADSSSCPITDMMTNGLLSSFIFCSAVYTGPNLSVRKMVENVSDKFIRFLMHN